MRNLKRALSLVMAAAMLIGMMVVGASAASKDFGDKNEIKNAEAVDVMVALGVINGKGDGSNFDPSGTLTRAEAAKIICYMLMGPANAAKLGTTGATFTDVPANYWAAPYIGYCASLGILSGTGDGTFNPEGKLDGISFGKMLLTALGYDAKIEGYTGSKDWSTNIAVDMVEAGISVDGIVLSDPISRDNACQMAFQTLTANMVRYSSKGTTVTMADGSSVVVGASDALPYVGGTEYNEVTGATTSTYLQFCEKYFPNLKKADGVADAYGRPSSYIWYVNNDKTTGYVAATDTLVFNAIQTPVVTSTAAIAAAELYNKLGSTAQIMQTGSKYTTTSSTDNKFLLATGASSADYVVSAYASNKAFGGNGVVTEIYLADNTTTTNVVEYIAVQIQPTLYKLGAPAKVAATTTAGAHTDFTVGSVTLSEYTSVVNAATDVTNFTSDKALAKDDYVLVYGNATAGYTVNHAAQISGKMTAFDSKSGLRTIGGNTYSASAAVDGSALATAIGSYTTYNADATFIVDNYGYVMGTITVTVPNNYLYVVKSGYTVTNLNGTVLSTTIGAKVLGTDGTISAITVAKVGDDPATTDNVTAGLYTYTVDAKTGAYTLTAATAATDSTLAYTSPAIASGAYANANTKFYIVNWAEGTADDYDRQMSSNYYKIAGVTELTGYAGIGNLTSVNGSYVDGDSDGIAEVVFIYTNGTAGATASYIYYLGTYTYDGTTYTYDVVKDGVVTTMTSTDISSGITVGTTTAGLMTLTAGTAAGVGTTSSTYSNGAALYCAASTTYTLENKGGLLYAKASTADTNANLTTTAAFVAAVADSVPVYTVSASTGAVTVGTAADLATAATATQVAMVANTATNAIASIWMVVA